MKRTPANPFQPGNRLGRGRPQGSRNKATLALQAMLDGFGESITKKCALLALQGDPTALRLCMERLIAPRKDHAVKFTRHPTTNAAEVAAAMDAILRHIADAQLTPAQGQMIMTSLEGRLRIIQAVAHEARMDDLESSEADEESPSGLIRFDDSEEEDSDEFKIKEVKTNE
jgi:hypothetical protein